MRNTINSKRSLSVKKNWAIYSQIGTKIPKKWMKKPNQHQKISKMDEIAIFG
jgi:hypothetical protein